MMTSDASWRGRFAWINSYGIGKARGAGREKGGPVFRSGFLWGCATSGYQVERPLGNADWDIFVGTQDIVDRVRTFHQRALSTVVEYEHPGEAVGHENLDVLRVELDRLSALGLNAYRFSVEWNRVQPTAPPDSANVVFNATWRDHYTTVISEIIRREMRPIITLNHMSLPAWVLRPPVATRILGPFGVSNFPVAAEDDQWRSSLRGWETAETVAAYVAFVQYFANAVKDRFSDVRLIWLTMNEPIGSMVGAGYLGALWSPGFGGEANRGKRVCLNLVKAHVLAYQALKAIDANWDVGFAHAMLHPTPTSYSSAAAGLLTGAGYGAAVGVGIGAAGGALAGALLGAPLGPLGIILGAIIGAIAGAIVGGVALGVVGGIVGLIVGGAQNVQQRSTDQFDYFYNDWILRALIRGEIDTKLTVGTTRKPDEWDAAWTSVMGEGAAGRGSNLDFVGLNYYRRVHVYYLPLASLYVPYTGGVFKNNLHGDTTEPHGVLNELGWEVFPEGLSSFLRRIKQDYDKPILITENGTPEALDANRAASLVAHVDEIRKATEDSDAPDVWGYIHWSNVDNWEWHEGYHEKARFGLHTVGDRNDPSNRVTIGSVTTFRRQLTEAGLALRNLIDSGDADAARARFGAIAAGGERVEVPTVSNGALWQGQHGGRFIKLFLDTTTGGGLRGIIYYGDANLWLLLSGLTWDGGTRQLGFTHPGGALPVVPALTAALVLDPNSHALVGQTTDPATGLSTPFNLPRVLFHGTWLPSPADASWSALSIHQLVEGDPVVKVLPRGDGNRWGAFRASGTTMLTFTWDASTFDLTLRSDPRHLVISQAAGPSTDMPTVPNFSRTRSSLAILGEI
jgi:beta-glucosidase/6-phospho-beta-glucosidase/beta-galactosidase